MPRDPLVREGPSGTGSLRWELHHGDKRPVAGSADVELALGFVLYPGKVIGNDGEL